ncbi:MAG: hypothetical protein WC600_07395 [Desulfobaccales bacterium]
MSDEKPYEVFLSCGTPHTQGQEDFISAIEAQLKSHNCTPQTVGRSSFSGRQPVEASRDLIGKCDGAIVIAFERIRIIEALDKPDSPEQKEIKNESHPTIWNQMEAAMAYAQRVPILTFVQRGVKRQGMLSDRFEWMALETDLSPSFLKTDQFQQVFREWLSYIQKNSTSLQKVDLDPAELKVGVLLSHLKTKQLWALIVAVSSILAGVATLAYKAGQLQWLR